MKAMLALPDHLLQPKVFHREEKQNKLWTFKSKIYVPTAMQDDVIHGITMCYYILDMIGQRMLSNNTSGGPR